MGTFCKNVGGSNMKTAMAIFCLLSFLLMGCSYQTNKEHAGSKTHSDNGIPSYYDQYILNPQVTDDRALQKVGERLRDRKGEATLKAVNLPHQTYQIGPIQLTIREAKILHYKPDYSLIDFYHSYTHEEEFDFVKLFVEIQNTADQPLQFAPVAIMRTNSGEQKIWEDDIYLEELNGKIEANGTKKGNLGFILENSQIESITIKTSDVFNEKDEKIHNAKEIKVDL